MKVPTEETKEMQMPSSLLKAMKQKDEKKKKKKSPSWNEMRLSLTWAF